MHPCPVCSETFDVANDGTYDAEETGVHPSCLNGLPNEHLIRIAHSFAIKYGLREHLTYQQAMSLETDLTTHLRAWRDQ